MQKKYGMMLACLSIMSLGFAQQKENSPSGNQIFDHPLPKITSRYWIDLGKSNRLRIELGPQGDIGQFANIDSILMVFIGDTKPFADSLADRLPAHRIDYIADHSPARKIRILHYAPRGNAFIAEHGQLSSLKLEQDTINIIMQDAELSFYINDVSALPEYITTGLNSRIALIRRNQHKATWKVQSPGIQYLEEDPSITSDLKGGYAIPKNDFLEPSVMASLQNYKNLLAPSFSLGALIHINSRRVAHEVFFHWEPLFLFASDQQGRLQTWRNDFLVLGYNLRPVNESEPLPGNMIEAAVSLGYLINPQGDYFEKNSFRITSGRLSLYRGRLMIEPCAYFHDLFKGVTPGLRLSLRF